MHVNPRKLFANESFNTLRFAQKVNSTNIGTAQKVAFLFCFGALTSALDCKIDVINHLTKENLIYPLFSRFP